MCFLTMPKYIEFKPGQKNAGKNAETSDTHESFRDCGLLLNEDDVVIDIDCLSKDALNDLIEAFDIKTQTVWTDRGVHFYFKKPEGRKTFKNGICKLGFKIEIFDMKKRPAGVTIKRNGVLREIENEGVREDLPDIFKISPKYKDLNGMDEGNGRNEALHNHKLKLNNCPQWLQILSFINLHIFATPLPSEEFQIVARQEDSDSTKEAPEVSVADAIITARRCAKWSGKIWFWDYETKSFISNDDKLLDIVCGASEGQKTGFIDEVIKQIRYRSKKYSAEHVFNIKLRGGFLCQGKYYPMEYEEFTPYAIDIEYKEDIQPVDIVDQYLTQLTTKEGYSEQDTLDYRNLLLEAMAFGLITDPERTRMLARFFLFRGEGANGKGTLLQIIRQIYQPQNCSALSIEQLGEMNYLTSMIGKLINLGDDVEDSPITKKQFKVIKNITSADTITVRFLYVNAEEAMIQSKLMFTTNNDIKTFDKGYALERRICWMPMFNKVEKPDPKFISKITSPEALMYWMKLIVEAYERLFEDGWTKSKISESYNHAYHLHNDITKMFIEEIGFEDLHYKTISEIEQMFKEWNTEDDRQFPKKAFKQNIWTMHRAGFGSKKVNGKQSRRLITAEETQQDLNPTFK